MEWFGHEFFFGATGNRRMGLVWHREGWGLIPQLLDL